MINTPFWVAHMIFCIAMLITNVSRNDVVTKYFDYVKFGCIGAQIMYIITELI